MCMCFMSVHVCVVNISLLKENAKTHYGGPRDIKGIFTSALLSDSIIAKAIYPRHN